MGEFICDNATVWEVENAISSYVRQNPVTFLYYYISLSTTLVLQLAAWRRGGGGGEKEERNGHLVALTNCYSKHRKPDPAVTELRRSFPTGFTGDKASRPGAACCRETDGPSPANAMGCLLLYCLSSCEWWGFPPQLQGSDFLKDFLKRTDSSI